MTTQTTIIKTEQYEIRKVKMNGIKPSECKKEKEYLCISLEGVDMDVSTKAEDGEYTITLQGVSEHMIRQANSSGMIHFPKRYFSHDMLIVQI